MLRPLRTWLRVVLLSEWHLWAALTGVLLVWLGQHLLALWLASFAPLMTKAELELITQPAHVSALLPLAFAFGLYRAAIFHPVAANRRYGTWLAQTPWRYPQPLPLGPLLLTWQDVAIVGLLLSVALLPPYGEPELLMAPPLIALVTYCGLLACMNWQLGVHWAAAAFVALLSAGILLIAYPAALIATAVLMYIVTARGVAASLREFPYSEQQRVELGLVPFQSEPAPDLALPILPVDRGHWLFRMTTAQSVVAGLLLGAIFFGIAFHARHEPDAASGMLLVHRVIAVLAIGARLFIYLRDCWPPISLRGRIATRRWVIPGYDIVLVAPLVAGMAALLLPYVLMRIGMAAVVAVPISTVLTVWLVLMLPPQLKEWLYTGHFRIPAVRRIGRDFVET